MPPSTLGPVRMVESPGTSVTCRMAPTGITDTSVRPSQLSVSGSPS